MKISLLKGLFAAIVFAASSSAASASVFYTYTGNPYISTTQVGSTPPYPVGSRITGTIELASALGSNFFGSLSPISFSFFDGLQTYDQATSTTASFSFFVTDASGNIVDWSVTIIDLSDAGPNGWAGSLIMTTFGDDAYFANCSSLSNLNVCDNTDPAFGGGKSQGGARPGLWTLQVDSVPEPSTIALIGMALLSLFGFGMMRGRADA